MKPERISFPQTVEVDSAGSQKALADMQTQNGALQEQLCAQRLRLQELETQLHESQRTSTQLRTQVRPGAVEGAAERLCHRIPSKTETWSHERRCAALICLGVAAPPSQKGRGGWEGSRQGGPRVT